MILCVCVCVCVCVSDILCAVSLKEPIPPPTLWNIYELATSEHADQPVSVGAASIVFASTHASI